MARMCFSCDYYKLLDLPPWFSPAELQHAFNGAVHRYHPERWDSPRARQVIDNVYKAFKVLSSPQQRCAFHEAWTAGTDGARNDPFGFPSEIIVGNPHALVPVTATSVAGFGGGPPPPLGHHDPSGYTPFPPTPPGFEVVSVTVQYARVGYSPQPYPQPYEPPYPAYEPAYEEPYQAYVPPRPARKVNIGAWIGLIVLGLLMLPLLLNPPLELLDIIVFCLVFSCVKDQLVGEG